MAAYMRHASAPEKHSVVEDLAATLEKLKVPEKEKSDLIVILGTMRMAVVQH
jgi:hypothetical protein